MRSGGDKPGMGRLLVSKPLVLLAGLAVSSRHDASSENDCCSYACGANVVVRSPKPQGLCNARLAAVEDEWGDVTAENIPLARTEARQRRQCSYLSDRRSVDVGSLDWGDGAGLQQVSNDLQQCSTHSLAARLVTPAVDGSQTQSVGLAGQYLDWC